MIWLRVCRRINKEKEIEEENKTFEFEFKRHKTTILLLEDIRQTTFWNLGFGKNDQISAAKAWNSLPTMHDAGMKAEDVYLKPSEPDE